MLSCPQSEAECHARRGEIGTTSRRTSKQAFQPRTRLTKAVHGKIKASRHFPILPELVNVGRSQILLIRESHSLFERYT